MRELWLSNARADIGEAIVVVSDSIENSEAGNFGNFVELIGRNLARGELTFSTRGVQASFPFACGGVPTTVEVELSRRQSWARDAGELH